MPQSSFWPVQCGRLHSPSIANITVVLFPHSSLVERGPSNCAKATMRDIGLYPIPPPSPPADEAIVTVHALSAGHLTLPEKFFVYPPNLTARRTVPSLAFLIQHEDPVSARKTRLLFDLGLRRDVKRYPSPLQRHVETRQPLTTEPDVVKSLAKGGLTPNDIDYVIYSHVCGYFHRLSHSRFNHRSRCIGTMLASQETSLTQPLSSETEPAVS